ncbi:MAG: hypothetical protein AAF196_09380 [Planctomycetota bacterium]
MLDRESTFTDQNLLQSLRDHCIPVALDQAYERRQEDAKGEFYRRIAGQGPRKDFRGSTQGFYLATADGELLMYNNNRRPELVARLVRAALERFDAAAETRPAAQPIEDGEPDPQWSPEPPDGGLVLRTHTRVLGGYPERAESPEPRREWRRIMETALGRDNCWLTREEHRALASGEVPGSAIRRIVRFHFVDNTRGEPPMWRANEVESLEFERDGDQIRGNVRLRAKDDSREYVAAFLAELAIEDGSVTRFDLIADGSFRGEGRYTPGAPPDWFPLAVSLTLADGHDVADRIPPQGSRGWVRGYLDTRRD